ncbi:cytochrome P450 [Phascolomyces articulosus]|uniref:Cytochrome P450 n=1 Tax=Phascolomyces articulosus TaxID=60185 RepID=A0AAD5JQP0_9FUNG|nr:cytochrome P450 [Phascolomyces articulosus]
MKPEIDKRIPGMTGKDPTWKRQDDILQDLMENYPIPTLSRKDIYTYYAGWMTCLFFPSVPTIANLISAVFHRLLQHPEIIEELINEQNEVFGDPHYSNRGGGGCFTIESARKLVKLDSVCRESFRTNKEFTASDRTNVGSESVILSNGVIIPPGQDVLLNLWINHQDNNLQKDTIGSYEKFEPYRHLETNHSVTKSGDDFLLFGIGKHVCPARWFTMHVVKTIISLLLRDYNIKSAEDSFTNLSNNFTGKVIIEKKKIQ